MKIFFDHKIFTKQCYGGPSRYYTNLVSKLNDLSEIEAKIYAPIHINYFLSQISSKNVAISNKLPFSKTLEKINSIKKQILKLNDIFNENYLKKFNPDIVHTTYYDENFPKYSDNLVITVFDLIHEIFSKDYGNQIKFLPKIKILKSAREIICISNSTKKDLIKFYDIPEEKISVTYLANSLTISNNIDEYENNINNDKYFLYVGGRWKYKNFSQLIYALNHRPEILNDLKLLVFGGGTFNEDEKKLFNKLNIRMDRITHINGDENLLRSLYKNAEFFIYTSKYEGFGIPILESFSQNCPVLCSNTSSLPEVAGDAAIYFNPDDYTSISEAIEKIIYSNNEKGNLIKKGRERLKLFSWEKCAEETNKVYKKILDTK